jgi:hypothetical protein
LKDWDYNKRNERGIIFGHSIVCIFGRDRKYNEEEIRKTTNIL